MKFTDYLKESKLDEGVVTDELDIKVTWEYPEGYSIVLSAKSSKDAMQALQEIEKYGDDKLVNDEGDMLDPDETLKGFNKLIKKYGSVELED